jgi:hypothetical protein
MFKVQARFIHYSQLLRSISKEESAKLQLKYLPNPLTELPKKKTAYSMFVKARSADLKGASLAETSKAIAAEWNNDTRAQEVLGFN